MSIELLDIVLRNAIQMSFEDSLTPTELMGVIVSKVNELTTAINGYMTTDITDVAIAQLEEWESDGTLADIIESLAPQDFNVKNYGAVGSGAVDDTAAINLAIAAATAVPNSRLIFPAATKYNVNAPIVIPYNINVIMDAPIEYTGALNITTLTVGAKENLIERKYLKLDVIRTNVSDWTDEDCIAIKIINPDACNIDVMYAYGHTIGLQMIGYGAGCVSNLVNLHRIRNCKICVDLTNAYYLVKGWANENQFFGGYLTHVGGFNAAESRYAIRISSLETEVAKIEYNNNNVFYKPCIELDTVAAPAESLPLLLEYASYNSFYDLRNEANGSILARTSHVSTENYITTGYGLAVVEELSTAPITYIGAVRSRWQEQFNRLVFDSGNLAGKACYYSDSAERRVSAQGIAGIISTSTGALNAYTRYAELYKDYIQCASGYGFGININTNVCKDFIIDVDAESGFGGRVLIKAYDVDNNILTSAGANHPYCLGISTLLLTYNAGYGGVYGTGVDYDGVCFVHLHADVDHITVFVTSGTANLKIRSLKVLTRHNVTTAANWSILNSNDCVATLTPVFGTYELGHRIKNAVPASGQPKAWICTVAGTMGTLNGAATIGDTTAAGFTVTVDDITDLRIGQYITIAGVTGIKKIVSIDGLILTVDTATDATVNNGAVAFSAGTFVSEGNL